VNWQPRAAERPLDRVGETEIYRQMVHDNPKRDDENAIEYAGRIADLVAEQMRGGRREEAR
jgi:hypothetical protein